MIVELVRMRMEVSQDKIRATMWKKNLRESVKSGVEHVERVELVSEAVGTERGTEALGDSE